jgi:RHS repeat-associated protein
LPRARARAKIASRKKFALYTQFASKNLRQVLERIRKNALAYDKVASDGSYLSIDPVTTDANSGGGFNRYAYVNSNPYRYIDPDGRTEREPRDICNGQGRLQCGTLGTVPVSSDPGVAQGKTGTLGTMAGGSIGSQANGSQQANDYAQGGQYEMNSMGDFVNPNAPGVGVGQMVAGGTLIAGGAAVVGGEVIAAGGIVAAKNLKRNIKVDGPNAGLSYGNGRVFQIRYQNKPVFRMDYQPIPGSNNQSRLHFHVGADMKAHYVVDFRGWFD